MRTTINLDLTNAYGMHSITKEIEDAIDLCISEKKERLWIIIGENQILKDLIRVICSSYGLTAIESLFDSNEIIIDFV